ncbi:MAG: UDP-N-acetylglucosamine 2-epimerase (non-hydrolyzing) [Candidatus Krumholzibacteriota bacterium]|nr:UDP-N-acetylglucosamine 2-epimerase (non-hydrolyzing) [Candidatus Krumholzibacteriota bacterium]
MSQPKVKIAVVVGTRPEAIKMAPVILELQASPSRWEVSVVATAQHRELLDQVFRLFAIRPDHDLDIMRDDQSLFDVTQKALRGLEGVLKDDRPDLVMVHGDTTTTFVGALSAYYLQIPVAHVEAGLRTGQRYSPFPEEMNRHLTGALTDLHFAPTHKAAWNLRGEGVDAGRILVTGNTVIDALLAVAAREEEPAGLPDLPLDDGRKLILMTAHRRESFGAPLERAFGALAAVAGRHPDCRIVYPVHPNPNVRGPAEAILGGRENVHLCQPLDYAPFVHLMKRAHLIITDSGGIQEEAPSLGVPVLVMRDVTERPEAVEAGTVKLVGTVPARIEDKVERLLMDPDYHRTMATAVNPYGDGQAARRIRERLAQHFYDGPPPEPFAVEA